MSDLQTAFYIVALVFMGVIFVIMLAVLAAVLVIRAKINAIHRHVEERIAQVTGLAEASGAVLGSLKKVVGHSKK